MRTRSVLDFYGNSPTKVARALGVKAPSICKWGDYPPPLRQLQLQTITGGKLIAEPYCLSPGMAPRPQGKQA